MRTSNPALNDKTFSNVQAATGAQMTIGGTVRKTATLLFLLVCGAAFTWRLARTGGNASAWAIGGAIGGLVFCLVTCFKKSWSPVTAPIYAVLEGLFLGAISAFLEVRFKGIVVAAVGLTLSTLACLLFCYQTRIIRATENFKLGIFAATGAIFLVYVVGAIMNLFGAGIPYIHDSGWVGIGFSLVVVGIAALNLVLDFDFIEQGCASGAPKYMEWFGAFGLMVTLVWLYVEILRLLSKISSRR
jgi:uncharacterized YccA/Bax inhibitor family protein